jgi:hypothetical protein
MKNCLFLVLVLAACGSDTPAPAPTQDGEDPALRALVDSLITNLEQLSGLSARERVRVATRTKEEVRAFVSGRLDEELPTADLEGIRAAYGLLGMIPDTLDLRALLLELYAEQIVGYYDPQARALHVVEGVDRTNLRPVLAHELVHALQDQHTNLDSLIARARGNDRQLAAQAAIEGHATLVMFAFMASEMAGRPIPASQLPDPAEQVRPGLEAANAAFPVFQRAPRSIRELLLFPYIGGASFVWQLWSQGNGKPAPPLGDLLPQSTEQVLHVPERFLAGQDEPTELRFEDNPRGWTVVYENTFGELESTLFLEEHLGAGKAAASGWDGDRYRVLRAPDGGRVLDWAIIFDDAAAARAFLQNARRALQNKRSAVEESSLETRAVVRVRIGDPGTPLDSLPVATIVCADVRGARQPCK